MLWGLMLRRLKKGFILIFAREPRLKWGEQAKRMNGNKMKRFSWIAAFLILSLAVVAWFGRGAAKAQTPWSPQAFAITYGGRIELNAEEGQNVKVWLPLASDRDGQKILKREIHIPYDFEVTRDPVHENEMAFFEVPSPAPSAIEFTIDYVAEVSQDEFYRRNEEQSAEKYLTPSRLMVIDEEVEKRVKAATMGRNSVLQKARAIFDDVLGHMSYDKSMPGWGHGDTLRACLLGKGNCTDFHSLFISMSLASHIPSRFKIGLPIPDESEGSISGYHCWAEFYDPRSGWQPVDVSESWKHPELTNAYFARFSTNKFLLSVGRDLILVPRQSDAPVNIFFNPYVEIDGVASEAKFEPEFYFRKQNQK